MRWRKVLNPSFGTAILERLTRDADYFLQAPWHMLNWPKRTRLLKFRIPQYPMAL